MKLQTKFFIFLGSLLLCCAFTVFFLSNYFIDKDVKNAAASAQNLIKNRHQAIENNQKAWIDQEYNEIQANVYSLLLMIYESRDILLKNSIQNPTKNSPIWELGAHFIGYDPILGMVQVDRPDMSKSITIVSSDAKVYPVKEYKTSQDDLSLIVMTFYNEANEPIEKHYLGVALPKTVGVGAEQLFALVDAQATTEEMKKVYHKALEARDLGEPLAYLNEVAAKKQLMETQNLWMDKISLIQILAPLVSDGIQISKVPHLIPIGAVKIDQTGNGVGVLSSEIFRDYGLFDAQLFYSKNTLTSDKSDTITNTTSLVKDSLSGDYFIVRTLGVEPLFVTLGVSLGLFAKEFALATNKPALFFVKDEFLVGYSEQGERYSNTQLKQLLDQINFKNDQGDLVFQNKSYTYSRISLFSKNEVAFYALTAKSQEEAIVNMFVDLNRNLTTKISSQMFFIFLISTLLALFILGRFTISITKPITQLAEATKDVTGGKYDEIILPYVGARKDEVATLTHAFEEMVNGLKEREIIRGVLNKVVSKDIADQILKSSIHLGGEDRIVTVLFSDIRDFTKLTADYTPQSTISLLNKYMTRMSRIIEGEGGIIDKYVGDEIMALYGAPTQHPDHAIRALSSAKLMIETLKRWNEEREKEGFPPIEMGIGIHTGLVVAGNMGAEDRLNYTVLGANVNLAARLCEVAQPMQVIISEGTLQEPHIKESFYVNPLPSIHLKGFSEPIKIYEVKDFKWDVS